MSATLILARGPRTALNVIETNDEQMTDRMTDQQFQNKITLRSLDYIRSVARILVEEIENGYPVSDALLDKVVKLHEAAFNIAHDKELKDVFQSKEI